ncbi:proline racemase family protein [Intrasporangium calvum]|uniref:Proline racemase family protein n=1 Tax=Intrasporangium calvum TaxID=53358 RepID=A0ABT5GK87_9MICO|nr:proline racemase family protein [Intrasporangium calvum]MDC5698101.1 proline racemase family protein [Intrasporangium calvum]
MASDLSRSGSGVELVTVDYHTGGEPFRIVAQGTVELVGDTVAEQRVHAIGDPGVQHVRALLCSEPRGHADMYGGFVTDPDDGGAELGVLFWHKDGFSTACGHGTIALGVWAVESGRVPLQESGSRDVLIDVPSGRVTARVNFEDHAVSSVSFVNVPSWVHRRGVPVTTSRGEVTCDIAFGGAMYAVLPASAVGLRVRPEDLPDLIRTGREIRNGLNAVDAAEHPSDPRLSGIYGTIFVEDVAPDDEAAAAPFEGLTSHGAVHQRNVVIFSDGEVDRSPCGSGTAARVALLADEGRLGEGDVLVHDSIVGSRFRARVAERCHVDGHDAVVPEVTGTAHRVGSSVFTVDPRDELVPGFVLR